MDELSPLPTPAEMAEAWQQEYTDPGTPPGQDTPARTLAEKYLAKRQRRDELEDELKQVKAEMSVLNDQLLDYLAGQGMDSATIAGHTFYTRTDLYVSCPEGAKASAIAVLENMGPEFQDIIKPDFSTAKLKAILNERRKQRDERMAKLKPGETWEEGEPVIPPELTGLVNVYEKTEVRATKAR